MTSQRDLRIDFFRGLALLIVVVDHIEGWSDKSLLKSWTLISLGFSDAAEIFVFLSGYVFAVAYSKTLDRHGLFACVKKAVKRALQIFVGYLLAAWMVIGIGALFIDWNPPYGHGVRIGERAWESVLASLTFRFQPWGFSILAFYVLVLPVMSLLLCVCRRKAPLAWAISAGIYVVVQMFPNLNFHRFADGKQWDFNPIAWQFLFFLGLYLGGTSHRRAPFVSRTLLGVGSASVLVLGLLVVKGFPYLIQWNPGLTGVLQPVSDVCLSWSGKQTLQPFRLLHFFALAYLISEFLPRDLAFWTSQIAKPIVVCGQQSLEVYALGLVLSFIGVFILSTTSSSAAMVLMLDADGCLLSIGFAHCLQRWKQRRSSTATEANAAIEI